MDSVARTEKPHAVCVPVPAQGHINPMLNVAKLLHSKGFHITFVNTEYNHRRLLKSRGLHSLDGLPDFCYETIPDGLPPTTDTDVTQDIPALCLSTSTTCLPHFRELLNKLNDPVSSDGPPVTCIVSDGGMTFTVEAAEEFGIPNVILWTTSACGFLGYTMYKEIVERGLFPLKDASYLTNGYLETTIDWIPGMDNIRLKDLPSFIRTTDPDDPNGIMVKFGIAEIERARRASAIIINTFDAFEKPVIDSLTSSLPPPIYTVGPLHLMASQISDQRLKSMHSNLWKEESECIDWLNSRKSNSVLYVNFGSIVVMSPEQLVEFAWGLANSEYDFLWILRPDLVVGESAMLPPELVKEVEERGMFASWCSQEQVLEHPAIIGFLTHCGWNSTIESVSGGVPMICWPFFAEQLTNCWYSCGEWGIGMEIDSDVSRVGVERQVRELMEGEKGKEMKLKAMEWKQKAEEAAALGGSSYINLDKVITEVLRSK